MAETVLNATVRETGESAYATDVVVQGHTVKSDQAAESGGKGLAPTPHGLLLAALGACTAQTVRWYASHHTLPLEGVDVELTYRRATVEGRLTDIFTKSVRLTGASLTAETRAKLIEVADKCPIQRLLEGNPVITTTESA